MMGGRARLYSVLMICGFLAATTTLVLPMEMVSAYSPHDPIYISGDDDFTEENGVTSGSGTPSDPYVISGWEITVSTETAIQVSDTSASFILTDLHMVVQSDGCAVSIWQASDFAVEECMIESFGNGIELWSCNDFSIEGNTVDCGDDTESNFRIIYAFYGTDFRFESNSITGFGMFGASYSDEIVISENEAMDNNLEINQCTNVTVSDNSVGRGITISAYPAETFGSIDLSGNTLGGEPIVYFSNQNHLSIKDQTVGQLIVANCTDIDIGNIELKGYCGIEVMYSQNVTISNCTINCSTTGIMVERCSDITIARNTVENAIEGVDIYGSCNTTIENNLLSGCNISIRLDSLQAVIRQNMIVNSTCAICFGQAEVSIYSNCFVDIIHPALAYMVGISYDQIYWNADYPIGGNYWSNYTGPDEFGGAEQDLEGADGFGDIPYSDGMAIDYYPLIESPDIEFGAAIDSESNGNILMWMAIIGIVAAVCIGIVIVTLRRK